MREIKFKGSKRSGRKVVFGLEDYLSLTGVLRETVKQLIGVDALGAEVYEGDSVIRRYEWDDAANDYVKVERFPMKATFDDYAAIANGEVIKCGSGQRSKGGTR